MITRNYKNSFTEILKTNLLLISRRLPDENLIFEHFEIGARKRGEIVIAYLKDLIDQEILAMVKKKIQAIAAKLSSNNCLEAGVMQDSPLSPFPQTQKTSSPEVAKSALLKGRVVILMEDNTGVWLAPTTLPDLVNATDDSIQQCFMSSKPYRVTRYLLLLFATYIPAFFIALSTFNPDLIPTSLAFLITGAREGNPFPVYLEVFLVMGVAELIQLLIFQSSSLTGLTIAFLTWLTLAGTGLMVNFISAPVILMTTLTTLFSAFALPNYDLRKIIRINQFFTMLMASILGLFGAAIAFFLTVIYLVTFKSFGVPYLDLGVSVAPKIDQG